MGSLERVLQVLSDEVVDPGKAVFKRRVVIAARAVQNLQALNSVGRQRKSGESVDLMAESREAVCIPFQRGQQAEVFEILRAIAGGGEVQVIGLRLT